MTTPGSFRADKPANPRPQTEAMRPTTTERPWRRAETASAPGPAQPGGAPVSFVPHVVHTASDSVAPAPVSDAPAGAEAHATAQAGPSARPETTPAPTAPVASTVLPAAGAAATPRRDLTPDLVRRSAPRPRTGWRALAYTATGGRWNPGVSAAEQKLREREEQIATRLRGRHVTAFFCLKGGISKTSTTAATSIALADLRPDPVFAIDANPDAGDLAERLVGERMSGISALAAHVDEVTSLEDLSRYTTTRGRLTVLPGEPNPTLGDSLRADDFEAVMRVVQRYYSFVQVDCGTGVTHPLMEGVLRFADTVVIPAAWSVTGAKRAAETIHWLADHGFEELARTCIVVLTAKDVVSAAVDKDAVLDFLSAAGDVVVVPADPHVADGALIEWDRLQPATRDAYLDIAAAITRRFRQA